MGLRVLLGQVTILILIDGFLQYTLDNEYGVYEPVTILILIDGFLQSPQTLFFQKPLWKSQSLF